MSKPTKHYDPVLKPRVCATCGYLLVGSVELGLTTWLDAAPLTERVEQVYRLGGRRTYHARLRPGGGAWVDTRLRGAPWPTEGVVLVEHPSTHTVSSQRASLPPWLTRTTITAPASTDIDF